MNSKIETKYDQITQWAGQRERPARQRLTAANGCLIPPRQFLGRQVEMQRAFQYLVEGHRCVPHAVVEDNTCARSVARSVVERRCSSAPGRGGLAPPP